MHASFELASKWAKNFPYSGEMDNLPSPPARPLSSLATDLRPRAMVRGGGFIFITKRVRGLRLLPRARAAPFVRS